MTYPGIEFVPPEGAIDPEAEEGEATVTWKRIGDRVTITSFEGMEVGAVEQPKGMSADEELDSLAAE